MNVLSEIAVIANGDLNLSSQFIHRINQFSKIYLVDGAANRFIELLKMKQIEKLPELIIGDFDSIDQETLNFFRQLNIPCHTLSRIKDKTDLEIALEQIRSNCLNANRPISIFGAFGNRIDHTLSNLFLFQKFKNIFFESDHEIAFLIENQKKKIHVEVGQTISLIPFFGSCIVSTKGLKWELNHFNLSFAGISNVSLCNECMIETFQGQLICMINHLVDRQILSF